LTAGIGSSLVVQRRAAPAGYDIIYAVAQRPLIIVIMPVENYVDIVLFENWRQKLFQSVRAPWRPVLCSG